MEIRVVNEIIDRWKNYNAIKDAYDYLCVKRLVLGRQFNLREYDINQHLINTLIREGKSEHIQTAKEHIVEVVSMLNDRAVICQIYSNLYKLLDMEKSIRYQSILSMQVTNKVADIDEKVNQLEEEVEALQAEKMTRDAYIAKYKKRNWWQRLFNTDVEL